MQRHHELLFIRCSSLIYTCIFASQLSLTDMAKRRPLFVFFTGFFVLALFYFTFWNRVPIVKLDSGLRFVQKYNESCALPLFRVDTFTFLHGLAICSDGNAFDCASFREDDNVKFKNEDCTYRTISRKGDFDLNYSDWHSPDGALKWNDEEILEVRCPNTALSDQYCAFRRISRRPDVVQRLSKNTVEPKYSLNIVAIGLDSMSRHTFLQQLSKSLTFFMNDLDGIRFDGYTIVGDGTTAAFLAMLAGVFEDDVHETRRGFNGATSLDDLPFIWKDLHRHGYVTLHDETEPGTGTFQLRLVGFDLPPVHYYGRPFQIATTIGKSSNHYGSLCFGNRSRSSEGLDYVYQLFEKYHTERKFAIYFDSLYTHNEKPRGEMFDDDLLSFLLKMSSSGHLDSTMLILFSDHGPRYGNNRQTIYGKYEERSPFLAIALPTKFSQQHPKILENLKFNGDFILTTPFDVHATFIDMLGISPQRNERTKGQSLFAPLPINRTCADANVAAHWCPCANGEPVDLDSDLASNAMKTFISTVNNEWLQPTGKMCMPLISAMPSAANIVRPGGQMASFYKTVDGHGRVPSFRRDAVAGAYFLVVNFRTEPGGGTWEATFLVDAYHGISVSRSQVSRTNAYGNAADCVTNSYPHLRQFCFCDFTIASIQ